MGFISMDKLLFASALISMTGAAGAFGTEATPWSSMGESSVVLEAYIAGFSQLQEIMKTYQELALKNVAAIRSIGDQMTAMDDRLINLWN